MRHRPAAVLVGVLAVLLAVALFKFLSAPARTPRQPLTSYSQLVADANAGKIAELVFRGSTTVTGRFKDGRFFESVLPHAQVIPGLTDRLLAKGVTIGARSDESVPSLLSVAVDWLPLLIFYGVFYVFFARPVLTLARQIEAYVRLTADPRAGKPPAPT